MADCRVSWTPSDIGSKLICQLSMVTTPGYFQLHPLDFFSETFDLGSECSGLPSPDEIDRRSRKSHHRYQLECEGPESYGDSQYGLWN